VPGAADGHSNLRTGPVGCKAPTPRGGPAASTRALRSETPFPSRLPLRHASG